MLNRVMVIDRRPGECAALVDSLASAGYDPVVIDDCILALEAVQHSRPATILVGRLSADMVRYEYCEQLRSLAPTNATAIIVLLPPATRLTRIRCLEAGADDVVDRDIPADRLIARLHRVGAPARNDMAERLLRYGPLEMSVGQLKVHAWGAPVPLNLTSFQVLRSFLERPEQIISGQDILATCTAICTPRSLYEHVKRLRQVMREFGVGNPIRTIPPSGYMLSLR